jgi:hypothetical protein
MGEGYCVRKKWRFFRKAVIVKKRLEAYVNIEVEGSSLFNDCTIKSCRFLAMYKLKNCFGSAEEVYRGGYKEALNMLNGLDRIMGDLR